MHNIDFNDTKSSWQNDEKNLNSTQKTNYM